MNFATTSRQHLPKWNLVISTSFPIGNYSSCAHSSATELSGAFCVNDVITNNPSHLAAFVFQSSCISHTSNLNIDILNLYFTHFYCSLNDVLGRNSFWVNHMHSLNFQSLAHRAHSLSIKRNCKACIWNNLSWRLAHHNSNLYSLLNLYIKKILRGGCVCVCIVWTFNR